ncbi:HD domain-containing protein [Paenibacillus sp. GCM10027626]|uniref:HD domain-containing protein n=1 Tax=Paenibacillus sp. GCM10027626 TaxID=3273411 RepID=UPI00363BE72D
MSTLTKALILAAQYHDGQTDKGGNPYILHPVRLMLQASTDEERMVALLHDIVEDTPVTLEELRSAGFSENIVTAVDCLSRQPDESYEQFIERIRGNDLARRVKILDLQDNSDLSRIADPEEKDRARIEKYRRSLEILEQN